ncbi:MAG: SRPBCC family protein [Acidobacteria bacterium]|nr:MAG: SRPBCC family protein [Acidobacteriota bacterium]REJ97999.1 MAG: SRPBCC family protein [Acidobacteriota bacterium]REK16742.1 MAG: SRPBCC family protein [Acidobacteriota bacterium]REK42653.1 MAG: SRPBCC family protein [Acidobacteriota bacterium]
MAIEVHSEIFIARPPDEVAGTMFNPKRDKIWIRSLAEVFPMGSGLYEKGDRVERVGDFMSRRYSAKVVVMKCEPGRMVELYADEPFEQKQRYMLSEAEGGTDVRITVQSIGEINYNSPITILSRKIREDLEGDLKKLKKFVESQ